MTILAQLSDPHLRVGPRDAGSARALEVAVEAVLALDPPPNAVIVTGDLADSARDAEYARAAELLEPLQIPVHVLAGNHDVADGLAAHFPRAGVAGRYRYSEAIGSIRLIACDTTIPGRAQGTIELDWLAAELEAAPDVVTVLAMHHPPIVIGLPGLDALGIAAEERAALGDLLRRSPQVRRVIAGHVHRTALATLGNCAVLACASTNLQARLEIGAPDFTIVPEPPSYAVHALIDDEIVSHVQPIG